MKKEIKKKKISITDLATTIDKLAISTANGFDRIEAKMATKDDIKNVDRKLDQHDKIFNLMIKELKQIHEDNKYFRQNISGLNSDGLSYDRKIENLTVRVEKLELNLK